jgi:hypothetical protein
LDIALFSIKKNDLLDIFQRSQKPVSECWKKKRYFVRQFGVFMVYLRLILENEEYIGDST